MSVIGKMYVSEVGDFKNYDSAGQSVKLSCVCEDQFMAHYHPENENVVFTQYSPWGEGSLHLDTPQDWQGEEVSRPSGEGTYRKQLELYLVYLNQKEKPDTVRCAFFAPLTVEYVADYGGLSRKVALYSQTHGKAAPVDPKQARLLRLELGIDNPSAADQFKPKEGHWWVLAFKASEVPMNEALALAHGAA
jgi:hypothetical protein